MTTDRTPPPCGNCGHAYGEHTGRSLGWETRYGSGRGPAVGPPDRFNWGGGCSFREDFHHTCPCAEWEITVNGQRTTQRDMTSTRSLNRRTLCAEGERIIERGDWGDWLLSDRITHRSRQDDVGFSGQPAERGLAQARFDVSGDGLQALGRVVLIEGGQVDDDLDVASEDGERWSSHADTVQHAVSNVKRVSAAREKRDANP